MCATPDSAEPIASADAASGDTAPSGIAAAAAVDSAKSRGRELAALIVPESESDEDLTGPQQTISGEPNAGPTRKDLLWSLTEPVAVWFRFTEHLTAQDVEKALLRLPSDERSRSRKFAFERDRRDFVAAHALLRDVLSLYGPLAPTEWQFVERPDGKPVLLDPSGLSFNITHTRGLVACALSLSGPVGVDAEPVEIGRDIDSISDRTFAPNELMQLRARDKGLSRSALFTELWTLKEAFLKASGDGLRRPLDEIAFRFPGSEEIEAEEAGVSMQACWRFALFAPRPSHRLTVAVKADGGVQFRAREWPDYSLGPGLPPTRWTRAS